MKYFLYESKNLILTLFGCIFFFFNVSKAQETFNQRLSFDRPTPTVITSIEVNDSCFYVCGLANDTISPYSLGSLFAKISFEGEVLWYKTLIESDKFIGTWQNTLKPTSDGNFIVTASYTDTTCSGIALIKYTPTGDTISIKKYVSPHFPQSPFMFVSDFVLSQNSGYIISTNITNPDPPSSDIYIFEVDMLGDKQWDAIYTDPVLSQTSLSLQQIENFYIIGGALTNSNFVSNNFIFRTQLLGINSEGDLEWEYLSPQDQLQYFATDILSTNDGGLLVASGKGIEIPSNPNYSTIRWHNYVFKLNSNHEFDWGVDIRDSFPGVNTALSKLIAVNDQSGYVVAGQVYQKNWVEDGLDYDGIITKISLEGDSLWTRYYNHVVSRIDNHFFYDLEETPDGGFVMVGQATDLLTDAEPPAQRAWIVKVDEHGCLVPGCHLISDITEPGEKPNIQISLYPNPTTDYLNIYFRYPNLSDKAVFDLIDATGRSVLQFESGHGDITHMVDVSQVGSGVYFLRCRVGNEIWTRKFIIVQ